jgi:hypothetical protein
MIEYRNKRVLTANKKRPRQVSSPIMIHCSLLLEHGTCRMNKEESKNLFQQCEEARKQVISSVNLADAETIAHQAAVNVWNSWALQLIEEWERLNRVKPRAMSPLTNRTERWTETDPDLCSWMERAKVDFSEYTFNDEVKFSNFIFPYTADFSATAFNHDAWFDEAIFRFEAVFDKATFNGRVGFKNTQFSHDTMFMEATFCEPVTFVNTNFIRNVNFEMVRFKKDVIFDQVNISSENNPDFSEDILIQFRETVFEKGIIFLSTIFFGNSIFNNVYFTENCTFVKCTFENKVSLFQSCFGGCVVFNDVIFKSDADFRAITSNRSFDLSNTTFYILPDFTQAHFIEAPRLDSMNIEKCPEDTNFLRFKLSKILSNLKANIYHTIYYFTPESKAYRSEQFSQSHSITSKYRALKRIAAQSADYERELFFFQRELCTMRLNYHYLNWRYFASVAYWLFSNFGRSVFRPISWWMISLYVSTSWYLSISIKKYSITQACAYVLLNTFGFQTEKSKCIDGDGTISNAAFGLAFHHGSGGVLHGEGTKQIYACLYGTNNGFFALKNQELIPNIPMEAVVFGAFQSVFSLTMIFLLILAVRNQFRIT